MWSLRADHIYIWLTPGIPRTLDDIAAISIIKRKSIAKCYRQIIFDLKLPIVDNTKWV